MYVFFVGCTNIWCIIISTHIDKFYFTLLILYIRSATLIWWSGAGQQNQGNVQHSATWLQTLERPLMLHLPMISTTTLDNEHFQMVVKRTNILWQYVIDVQELDNRFQWNIFILLITLRNTKDFVSKFYHILCPIQFTVLLLIIESWLFSYNHHIAGFLQHA